MVDVNEVVTAASQLNDAEFLEVVRRVAADRPGLASLRAAASGGGGVPTPPIDFAGTVPDAGVPNASIPSPSVEPDYTAAGVPTFGSVRDKIEHRVGSASGTEELDHESASGRSVEEQWAAREKAGKARLDEIRRSLGK
ncbi:MAG: hypothetical protein GX610_06085 [Rhodococcus sp.]|nr:hypothetical protein [Rhodococcus sp. (in: high G+C Gram-positive bacteria)]